MVKVLKKILLLVMLIGNLFKQLMFGLTLFLYNRALGNRWGAIICVTIVGLLILFGALILLPGEKVASSKPDKLVANANVSVEGLSINDTYEAEQAELDEEASLDEELQGQVSENGAIDTIEQNLREADAISFQATEIKNSPEGRTEPFAPSYVFGSGSEFFPEGGNSIDGKGIAPPSPQEIAKQKAEERRNEIRGSLDNDITVKGILMDANKIGSMAVVEIISPDGRKTVRTVKAGEVISLPNCTAKINKILEDKIAITSEDIKYEKYLPQFKDEDTVPVANVTNNVPPDGTKTPSDNLIPPPNPAAGKASAPASKGSDSSIDNAKKKIDEIDKLLNSF